MFPAAVITIGRRAASLYIATDLAGDDGRGVLLMLLHGVAAHLQRAHRAVPGTPAQIVSLYKAGCVLDYLICAADRGSPAGGALCRCYNGIQRLILAACTAPAPQNAVDLSAALGQARLLESDVRHSLAGRASHAEGEDVS